MLRVANTILSQAARNHLLFKLHRQLNQSSPFDLETTSSDDCDNYFLRKELKKKNAIELAAALMPLPVEKTEPVKKGKPKKNLLDEIAPAQPIYKFIPVSEERLRQRAFNDYYAILRFIQSITFLNSTQYYIEQELILRFKHSNFMPEHLLNELCEQGRNEPFPELYFPRHQICIRLLLGADTIWAKQVTSFYLKSDRVRFLIILSAKVFQIANPLNKEITILPYNIHTTTNHRRNFY